MTKGEICVLISKFSDSQEGQVNLESRIAQEKLAEKIYGYYLKTSAQKSSRN